MTQEQFDALSRLLRLRTADKSRQAAFLQLVEGLTAAQAAITSGVSPNAASKAANRVRRGLALAIKSTTHESTT